jgi:DNA polymerase
VRDILVYHTASTGRFGGAGVQFQNLPRGNIKEIPTALKLLVAGDHDLIRPIFGEPMGVFSSLLRSMIIPEKGNEFFCADYAAIEARVLFWVAGNKPGMDAFRDGRDLYKELAMVIFNHEVVEEVTKDQRFVGKTSILGAGYGMGPKKFQATCEAQGAQIHEQTAKLAIATYRKVHFQVVSLWDKYTRASIAATQNPGKIFSIKKTKWYVKDDFLYCELPSSRKIAYHKPSVKYELTPWGEKRPVLYHYGVNGLTRKWEESSTYGGKLTENVVQAIARDLMAEAMLRIEKAGYEIVLTVHDELLAERKKGFGDLKHFCDLMNESPEWAKGCPINVEGWQGDRYRK